MDSSTAVRSMGWTQRSAGASILLALDLQRREAGQRVVQLREARGWTQEDLAHEADVSVKTISRLENGHRESRTGTLEVVAQALGVSRDDILPRPAPLGLGLDSPLDDVIKHLEMIESGLAAAAAKQADMQTQLDVIESLLRQPPSEETG